MLSLSSDRAGGARKKRETEKHSKPNIEVEIYVTMLGASLVDAGGIEVASFSIPQLDAAIDEIVPRG